MALDWIKSYLANRSQYVCYNKSNSEMKNIQCNTVTTSLQQFKKTIKVDVAFLVFMNSYHNVKKITITVILYYIL